MSKQTNAEPVSAQTETAQAENCKLRVTYVTQLGNAELGTPDKLLYYLILETKKGKRVVNIGQKTYDEIFKLIA